MRAGEPRGASRDGRALFKAVAIPATLAGLLILVPVLAAAAAVYRSGLIVVEVEEKRDGGTHLHVPVPVALLHAGLAFVPSSAWRGDGRQLRDLWPVIEGACAGLERSPDGTLVQVDDGDERVMIVKKGRALVVDVDTRDERVHLSIPVGAFGDLARQLAAAFARHSDAFAASS